MNEGGEWDTEESIPNRWGLEGPGRMLGVSLGTAG